MLRTPVKSGEHDDMYQTRSHKTAPPSDVPEGATGEDGSNNAPKYSDEERLRMENNMAKRAAQLQADAEALRKEREKMRAEDAARRRERAEVEETRSAVREMTDMLAAMRAELNSVRHEVENRRDHTLRSPSLPAGQRFVETPGLFGDHN